MSSIRILRPKFQTAVAGLTPTKCSHIWTPSVWQLDYLVQLTLQQSSLQHVTVWRHRPLFGHRPGRSGRMFSTDTPFKRLAWRCAQDTAPLRREPALHRQRPTAQVVPRNVFQTSGCYSLAYSEWKCDINCSVIIWEVCPHYPSALCPPSPILSEHLLHLSFN